MTKDILCVQEVVTHFISNNTLKMVLTKITKPPHMDNINGIFSVEFISC